MEPRALRRRRVSLAGDAREVEVAGLDIVEVTPQKVILSIQVHLQVQHHAKSVSARLSKIAVSLIGCAVGDGNDSHGGRQFGRELVLHDENFPEVNCQLPEGSPNGSFEILLKV